MVLPGNLIVGAPVSPAEREEAMNLYFACGDGRQSSRVFENVIRNNDTGKLNNVFLHSVVEVNGLTQNIQ